jgi:peptidyl-prolyl cis-trans isomerase B (cyclophilin B)
MSASRLVIPALLVLLLGAGHTLADEAPRVVLETNRGNITIELDPVKAPRSAANFLDYVAAGYYDGTIFHRVIPGFMVQGGGFTADMIRKPTRDPIENEADNGLQNKRGTLAMARTQDPHSASAQFFVNVVDNDFLDHQSKTPRGWGYAVFGSVVDGMNVVDDIAAVETGTVEGMADVPLEAVVIEHARVLGATP